MKKFISVLLSLCFAFSLCGCSNFNMQQSYTKSFIDLFDTACTITAYDTSQEAFNEHFEDVYSVLKSYSNMLDIYNDIYDLNNLKSVNDNGAKEPVKVDDFLLGAIDYGKQAYDFTNGRVNVAMGSVLSIWHDKREEGKELPDMQQLKQMSSYTNIDYVIVDNENQTVSFGAENVSIDFGALAKGYACEKIAQYINDNDIWSNCVINLGGNVKTIGTKNGKNYNIAIENPRGDDYLCTVGVSNGKSVVTSGDYQRYYTVDGVNYCHIINPDTLMPVDYMESVTVICNDSAYADAISTMLFTISVDDGLDFVEKDNSIEAMWVDNSGQITYSTGFEEYIN